MMQNHRRQMQCATLTRFMHIERATNKLILWPVL